MWRENDELCGAPSFQPAIPVSAVRAFWGVHLVGTLATDTSASLGEKPDDVASLYSTISQISGVSFTEYKNTNHRKGRTSVVCDRGREVGKQEL